jgi:hypothetical protein
MWDSGGETTYGQCEVIDIEMPLIKVKGMSGDKAHDDPQHVIASVHQRRTEPLGRATSRRVGKSLSRVALRVADLDPISAFAAAIRRIDLLRHDAFQTELARLC